MSAIKQPAKQQTAGKSGNDFCVQCEKKTNGKMTQCWYCDGWLHHKCINLPENGEPFLSSDFCILTCQKCHTKTIDLLTIQRETQQSFKKLKDSVSQDQQALTSSITTIKTELENLKQQVSNVNTTLATTNQQTSTYAAAATKLGSQLDTLRNCPGTSSTPVACNPAELQVTVLSSLQESAARDRRKQNVCVFNFSESNTSADNSDSSQFVEFCTHELGITPTIENAYRLGKPQAGKVRPLLVRLSDENVRRRLLHKSKELRVSENQTATKVFIRPDLTMVQQAENKKLYMELTSRIKSDPTKYHQIRNGSVISTEKIAKNGLQPRLVEQTILDASLVRSSSALASLSDQSV